MTDVLSLMNEQLEQLGLNYEFDQMTKKPLTYPYWVGDYTLTDSETEDGRIDGVFILTGFSRTKRLELEIEKEKIEEKFKNGFSKIKNQKSINFFFSDSFNVPSDDNDLKRCQVNISFKVWSK